MSKDSISTDQELRVGDYLNSLNGNYRAIFQHDGNFVIYSYGSVIWETGTSGSDGFRILLQQDTNLVMYNKDDTPIWASGTYSETNSTRMRLTLTNDGQLVLDNNGQTIWTAP